MSRPPKTKTAEWRRYLMPDEVARADVLDRRIASLQAQIAKLSEERRQIVAAGMNKWQYEKRQGSGRKS